MFVKARCISLCKQCSSWK